VLTAHAYLFALDMLLKVPPKPLSRSERFVSIATFERTIMLYSWPLGIFVYIWIVAVAIWIVAIDFRMGPVYFQLSGQISFEGLEKVSSVPAIN